MDSSTNPREPGRAAPGHSADAESLAGLYAFGVLEGAELARFERHLATCGRCADVVAGDEIAVMALGLAAPEAEAAPDLKGRLLARARAMADADAVAGAASGLATPAPVTALMRRDRPRPPLAWILPLAALALVLLGGAALIEQMVASAQIVATAPLENRGGVGQAEVVVRRSGEGVIHLHGLQDLGDGRVYQAWVIRPNSPPLATGASPRGDGTLTLDGDVRGVTVAVTLEPRPGARAPSAQPFLVGQVPT